MIDLVTANEFTFTPSAFIAAYIEQLEEASVSETSQNGGSLATDPEGTFSSTLTLLEDLTDISVSYSDGKPTNVASGALTISGDIASLVGNTTTDTRTTTKTSATSKGSENTVVLVLSYGQFKAKCANAQATVTLIHTRVADYLNSLT